MAPSILKSMKSMKNIKIFKKKKPQFLEGITIQSLTGDSVLITDLWAGNTVILKVLRRFGCPLCRYESRLLSNLKPYFDELNVRLIGIGFEEVGLQEFLDGKYWEWELFLDTDRTVHKALGLVKYGIVAGLADLVTSASRKAVSAALKLGIKGNFDGDGFQLGGTFVVGPGNTGLLYEYRQTAAAIYPSIKDLFAAAGGNPNLVQDMAPEECIFYQESMYSASTDPSLATSKATSITSSKYYTNSDSESDDGENFTDALDDISVYS